MKLSLQAALDKAAVLAGQGDEASTVQAEALRQAVASAQASGETEVDVDQALLDLDTKLAAETQQAIDKLG